MNKTNEKQIHLLSNAALDDEYDEVKAFPLNDPLLTILMICP